MKSKQYNIRFMHPDLYDKVKSLSKEQDVSINMAINMLLGFAFNEIQRQDKKFEKKVVFEAKE